MTGGRGENKGGGRVELNNVFFFLSSHRMHINQQFHQPVSHLLHSLLFFKIILLFMMEKLSHRSVQWLSVTKQLCWRPFLRAYTNHHTSLGFLPSPAVRKLRWGNQCISVRNLLVFLFSVLPGDRSNKRQEKSRITHTFKSHKNIWAC